MVDSTRIFQNSRRTLKSEQSLLMTQHFLVPSSLSNIRRTLVGNYIFDRSDVVGASPVGAAPTTSSFST